MLFTFRFLLVLFILLPPFCFAQSADDSIKKPSDRESLGLVGPVKSVIEKHISTKQMADMNTVMSTVVEEHSYITPQIDFDVAGKRIYDCRLTPMFCGSGDQAKSNNGDRKKFDAQGRLTEKITFQQDGSFSEKETLEYGANGNLIKRTFSHSTGDIFRIESYGEMGNLLDSQHLTNGRLYASHKFDQQGRLIEYIDFFDDLDKAFRIAFQRNEKGDELESLSFTLDSNFPDIKIIFSYEYDTNGNWIKRVGLRWELKNNNLEFLQSDIEFRTINYFETDK